MRVGPFSYGSVVLKVICHFLFKLPEQGDTQKEGCEDEEEEEEEEEEEDYVSLAH